MSTVQATTAAPAAPMTPAVPAPIAAAAPAKPAPVMTAERLRRKYPAQIAALTADAASAGAGAERERILGIQAAALPGHGDLVAKLVADPKTSVGDAARMILAAEKEKGPRKLAALKADDPKGVAPAVSSEAPAQLADLPPEQQARATWDRDAGVRAEFRDDFKAYAAYVKANAAGRVRLVSSRKAG